MAAAGVIAAANYLVPARRVGVGWENRRFMPREDQGPFIPIPPRGDAWYREPLRRWAMQRDRLFP
jgi:hypothetical protein